MDSRAMFTSRNERASLFFHYILGYSFFLRGPTLSQITHAIRNPSPSFGRVFVLWSSTWWRKM
jgi:hypothetical protein